MTPPAATQYCSPEVRAHPLPGDRCADESQPYHPPERRFRMLSLNIDLPASFSLRSGRSSGADFWYREGIGALFRPIPWLAFGAHFDGNAADELTLMGRIQGQIPLHRFGMMHLDIAALAGLRQMFAQPHDLGAGEVALNGSLFAAGAHLSFNFQLTQEISLFPYFRFLLSPATEVSRAADGARATLPLSYEFQFGLGWSIDLIPSGF
jgi:hypothetical protein